MEIELRIAYFLLSIFQLGCRLCRLQNKDENCDGHYKCPKLWMNPIISQMQWGRKIGYPFNKYWALLPPLEMWKQQMH